MLMNIKLAAGIAGRSVFCQPRHEEPKGYHDDAARLCARQRKPRMCQIPAASRWRACLQIN